MGCTTILVGKKASHDGSTMIARNDDGFYDVKKLVAITSDKQPRKYKSVIGKLEIELPDNPMRYTACPSVDGEDGIWAACGINEANVAMTATETITTNPLVMGADPYVVYHKDENGNEIAGGIGEEDLVVLVLPYIHSAREGVIRLGSLLEKYGTYESNGIGFSDENEVWWLESIGGHHWMAIKVKDEEIVIMPNQLGIDHFDFTDAYGQQKEYMCSSDLKKFIENNCLDTNNDGRINPRNIFGSHSDADHVYNSPRGWYMARYFNPTKYRWDGENADFTPESDNIPFALVPERKVTVEDVKYILSSYYQGTPYNPYLKADSPLKGIYRPIGIARTGVMACLQIRGYMPEEIKAIEWICFGSNNFNAFLPVYANTNDFPKYLSEVTTDVSTENFYWSSRIIGGLADPHFGSVIQLIERYQTSVANQGHQIINEYDKKMLEDKNYSLIEQANEKLCQMCQKETIKALNNVLLEASKAMKNNYSRADN